MMQAESSSPATTSYSSPAVAWSRTLVHASVSASSMSVRQSSATPSVRIEALSTRRTTGTLSESRGSCSVNLISTGMGPSWSYRGFPAISSGLTRRSRHSDGEVLDDRIRQQRLGDLSPDCLGVVTVDLQLEVLALTDSGHLGEAEGGQGSDDRLPLRVEDLRLQHHVDDDSGHLANLSAGQADRR